MNSTPSFVLTTARFIRPNWSLVLAALLLPVLCTAQPTETMPRAGWRVGGVVNAIARQGSVLYLAGLFRGIAPESNGSGGMLSVDATSGLVAPQFPAVTGTVFAVEPDGAGGWYVGGAFLDVVDAGVVYQRMRLAHILPSGAIDPNWAPIAIGGSVRAIRFVAGVGVFVGGDFTTMNGAGRSRVALLDATTGVTLSWSYAISGGAATVRALAHHAGHIFIGGDFTTVDGQPRSNLVLVSATASGQMSDSFAVDAPIETIAATTGPNVYIGGSFATMLGAGRGRIARLTHAAGLTAALDTWNPGASSTVRVIVPASGTVFVGGDFLQIGGQSRSRLAQLDEGTAAPTAFAPVLNGPATTMTLRSGTLFVGGLYDEINGELRNGLGAVSTANGATVGWNPSPAGTTNALAVSGTTVAVAGFINGYGAVPRLGGAAVDVKSGQILPWNPRANNQINELIIRGSTVYLAGTFQFVGGVARNYLAAVDSVLGQPPLPWNPNPNGTVSAMLLDDTSAYIGGTFTSVGGQSRGRLARVSLATGAVDAAFTPSADSFVNAFALQGTTLYAAGEFSTISGATATRVAALNAQTGALVAGFAGSANSTVQTLEIDGGLLYLAGLFTQVNGTPRTYAARVNAATGVLDGWAPSVGYSPGGVAAGSVPSLLDIDVEPNVVLLSGAFDQVGGQFRLGLAAVDKTTGAVTSWVPYLGTLPYGGIGSRILADADLTAVGGFRIQLADELLNGLALFVEPAALAPQPPAGVTSTVAGSTITLTWSISPSALPATSFIVEAGSARGTSDIATIDVGNVTTYSVANVPPGTYYVRVRSVTSAGVSTASPDIALIVGGAGCTAGPQAPTNPAFAVAGTTVTISWYAPAGAPPSGYTLLAGTQPGLSNVATLDVGPATSFSIPNVPPGAYYVRIVARNACGISAPSSELAVNPGGVAVAPMPPLNLTGRINATSVSFAWIAPPGSNVTSYILEVGSGPGLTNFGTYPVSTTSFSSVGMPPLGRYYTRVRAVNSAGVSLPSNEVVLTIR